MVDGTASVLGTPAVDARHPPVSLSQKLRGIAVGSSERISISDIADGLGQRSFAALFLAFAFPNLLPMPPGASAVLGAPLVVLSAQFMLRRHAWLPGFIGSRSLRRADFAALVARAVPWLERAERLLRPRLSVLASARAEPVIGLLLLILSVILALPIPLGNFLPAFAICLFAFGVLERDGLWVMAGFAVFCVALTVVGGLAWGTALAAIYAAEHLMG